MLIRCTTGSLMSVKFQDWKWTGVIYYIHRLILTMFTAKPIGYLTIIPRAQMGYWLRGHEGERNNCFSKIQLVGQKNIKTKHL